MLSPTPAVRAALVGLIVVTVVALAGAGLHLGSVQAGAEASLGRTLGARASTMAVALQPASRSAERLAASMAAYEAQRGATEITVVNPFGRIVSTTNEDLSEEIDWLAVAAAAESSPLVQVGEESYAVAAEVVGTSGMVVGLAAPTPEIPTDAVFATVTWTLSLWGALVGVLLVMTWYAGPRTASQLGLLGERIGQGNADGAALVRHAGLWLGPLADAFNPVVKRIRALNADAADTKDHVAALYQVNPHYLLLCSLDGSIVEANPAFYAVTGLPIETIRGGRVDALDETFPIGPLMDLAERSFREASAISGMEYAIIDRKGNTRPVEVSLRAFASGSRKMVLIQATDQAHAKTLERRVASFTDTLDLMVDQRVHQLTAGQQALTKVLAAAGVAIASFDAGGATNRWSAGARSLTGQAIDRVAHFAAATVALGLDPDEQTAFTRWFWSASTDPFVAHHHVPGAAGPRVRQFIWQRVDAELAGRTDLRTLVGIEIPTFLEVSAAAGDGQSTADMPAPAEV